MEMTFQIEELSSVAKQILEHCESKTVLFNGDMGVGKTTLIKSLVRALGSTDVVSSPTFSIVNEYSADDTSIYHFDLYRIEDEEEALNFGFEDYFQDDHWVFIEWPDRALSLMPEDAVIINISYKDQTSRTLKLSQNRTLTQKNAMEQYKI
ncbi:MAG: tRNA (adenosine(37)-N6)-threonylcarbamoyltransferase complex ATPase subunit type 1 TsaE [Algicola sp.]|nr:tRNA (adenosine(37)-N6)-threonylcarbamoyltransferase complex ATPase subunit type 1 TsaE [Algicola sp.]